MGDVLTQAAAEVGIRVTLIDAVYLKSDVSGSHVTRSQPRFSGRTIDHWSERVVASGDPTLGTSHAERTSTLASMWDTTGR